MKTIDPEKVFHKVNAAGQEWVEAQAKAQLYEDSEKSELSTITMNKLKAGATSMAQAEAMARSDPDFKDYVKTKVLARKEANEAKVRYESAKIWWEAMRTQAATLRNELSMTGGR